MTPEEAALNVLLGMIGNGLTELVSQGWAWFRPGEPSPSPVQNDESIRTVLQKAATATARHFPDDKEGYRLKLLLVSPEAESVVRQLFATELTSTPSSSSSQVELIRKKFRFAVSLHLRLSNENAEKVADPLFDALVAGCLRALSERIGQGNLAAHEALAAYRHREILDELTALHSQMRMMDAHRDIDVDAILLFEETYRQQVGRRHADIVPPNLDAARRVAIEEIYVPARFTEIKQEGAGPEVVAAESLLARSTQLVVLGNPGGGKSTFALKVCRDLATQYDGRLFAGRRLTPVLVVLRDYGQEKREHHYSILQHIEATATSKYQVQPPAGGFEYLLSSGRIAVVFDGLDELLDTVDRREITADVESFCNLYPSVPVLVTSREVGYEQAPLDEKRFKLVRLAPFDEEQVKDYVVKWFALDLDLTKSDCADRVARFLSESDGVPDLRSNPLMLGLMCSIYRGENYIPRNRPDVYEKCATLLFERWDRGRGIHVILPFEEHISSAMKYLAYWIYANPAYRNGVTEQRLVAKVTEYLLERRFDDRDEAENAARQFVNFCRGRAWVFTDTGSTAEGERLYQFTHQTFLEYFAAAHLTRVNATPSDLVAALVGRIERREWDVVAQLAIQIQNKHVDGAGDKILGALVEHGASQSKGGWHFLLFAARCLEFMVPSPRIVKRIVTSGVERLLHDVSAACKEDNKNKLLGIARTDDGHVLAVLMSVTIENRAAVAAAIEEIALDWCARTEPCDIAAGLELALHVDAAAVFFGDTSRKERQEFWGNVKRKIAGQVRAPLKEQAPHFYRVAYDAWEYQVCSLQELLRWHGLARLFSSKDYFMFPHITTLSVAERLMNGIFLQSMSPGPMSQLESDLGVVGREYDCVPVFEKRQDPGVGLRILRIRRDRLDKTRREPLYLEGDSWFGAFGLLATIVEEQIESVQNGRTALVEVFRSEAARAIPGIDALLLDRIEGTQESRRVIEAAPVATERKAILRKWISGELSFYSPAGRS